MCNNSRGALGDIAQSPKLICIPMEDEREAWEIELDEMSLSFGGEEYYDANSDSYSQELWEDQFDEMFPDFYDQMEADVDSRSSQASWEDEFDEMYPDWG